MSKVTRQDVPKEHYDVMQDWLILFAHEFEKQAYLENLKPAIYRRHFSSIDEKMADIKKRIGFDVVSKFTEEIDDINKKSEVESCDCKGSCCDKKTANYKHPESDIKKMAVILQYIEDMVRAEPTIDSSVVISRCRNTDGLGFAGLRIDDRKLRDYIEDLLSKYSSDSSEDFKYQKIEADPISAVTNVEQADYYNHARPNSY